MLFLVAMLCAVGLSYLFRQTTDHSMLLPHEVIDAEANLTPNAEELDASDLEFDGFERIADVSYGQHGWRNQLDLYLPVEAPRPLPVIVYCHGAGTSDSNKDELTPYTWAPPLLKRGYAFVQINYRVCMVDPTNNPHADEVARFPAQVHDCKAAIRFLRTNATRYGLDPDRLGVMGFSFGGYLAALVGTTGDSGEFEESGLDPEHGASVQAVCVVSGLYDFASYFQQWELHSSAMGYPQASIDSVGVTPRGLFGDSSNDLAMLSNGSPFTYASRDDPPFLIVHGFRDPVVPPHQADMLYVRLRNAGVDATLNLIPGGQHGGPTLKHKQTRSSIVDFFNKHLKKQTEEAE
jgi:acetyl esterase/lipase